MVLPEKGHLLRIFIGESDKRNGMPLYEWIVKKARGAGTGRSHGYSRHPGIRGALTDSYHKNSKAVWRYAHDYRDCWYPGKNR